MYLFTNSSKALSSFFRYFATNCWSVNTAPRPGLEPGTISLHMIHNFRNGVDYLISQKGSGYIVSTHLSFDKAQDKSSASLRNLARDCQLKGFPELARFFNSYYYEKLPYSTGSRSTIELPRNTLLSSDMRILSDK